MPRNSDISKWIALMAYKVGDVVELKSGGPNMTVATVGQDGRISCEWFNQEGGKFTLDRSVFYADQLKPVDREAYRDA